MGIQFQKLSEFNRGILLALLTDAYSFDLKYEQACRDKWKADDDFFFDNLQIGDKYCSITTLDGEALGFVAWDPRNLPAYAIIGDNCIVTKHKGKGYGKLQLQETINRITKNNVKKIFVSTNNDLIPAQRMYERIGFIKLDNSLLEPWQISQNADVYYGMDIRSE